MIVKEVKHPGNSDNCQFEISEIERTRFAYFWRPGTNAAWRRSNEKKNTWSYEFEILTETDRFKIEFGMTWNESCKNIYRTVHAHINGYRTNMNLIKKANSLRVGDKVPRSWKKYVI